MTEPPRPPSDDAGAALPGPPPPIQPKTRRPDLIALGVLGAAVLVAVVYNFYWDFSARQFRVGIEQWLAARAQEGTRVTYAAIRVDGYPFHLTATITQPSAARFTGAQPWSWRGPAITLDARPWRPSRLKLTAPGRHWLTTVVAGRAREYDVAVEALILKLRVGRAGVARARLAVGGLVATEEGAGEAVRLAAADVALRRAAEIEAGRPALELTADAAGLALATEPVPGLGRVSERLGLTAAVVGAPPAAMTGDELAMWRDRGGVVEVRRLGVRHGTLAVDGDGTVALDSEMQPIAAFTVRVRGYDQTIDALTTAGVVKPRPAALAKAALGLLAAGQGAKDGELKVPLSIQDRRLYLGPVAVARLPAVAWD